MGRIDVEIETVLALVLQVRQQPLKILVSDRLHLVLQFWHHLGANGRKFLRFSRAPPRFRGSRWRKSQEIDRRFRVRHSWKHRAEDRSFRSSFQACNNCIEFSTRIFSKRLIKNSPPFPFLGKLLKSWSWKLEKKLVKNLSKKVERLKWKY